jgi:hypothetical protein
VVVAAEDWHSVVGFAVLCYPLAKARRSEAYTAKPHDKSLIFSAVLREREPSAFISLFERTQVISTYRDDHEGQHATLSLALCSTENLTARKIGHQQYRWAVTSR